MSVQLALASRGREGLHRWHKPLFHAEGRRHVHRGRERVVRRLRHVHVVVGMDRLMTAERLAGDLRAAVGDHLVDVHIELGAAASHPDMQRELVLVLAVQDFVADTDNQVFLGIAKPARLVVDQSGRLFDDRVGGDHLAGHEVVADTEMLEGPLRLSPPKLVGRDVDRTEAVLLDARSGHGQSFRLLW